MRSKSDRCWDITAAEIAEEIGAWEFQHVFGQLYLFFFKEYVELIDVEDVFDAHGCFGSDEIPGLMSALGRYMKESGHERTSNT